ncbi:MAG: hypothetical protein ACHWZW_07665 [Spirulina sp.]
MNGAYLATAGRIRQELTELDQVVARIENIWTRRRQEPLPAEQDYWVDAVALNLHSYYAGVERILELIADAVDQAKPSGAMWHRDLLQQMTADLSGIRPAVLTIATRNALDRYRGFRHVLRNIYTFSLDAEQIELLVVHLPTVYLQVKAELEECARFLEQSAQG